MSSSVEWENNPTSRSGCGVRECEEGQPGLAYRVPGDATTISAKPFECFVVFKKIIQTIDLGTKHRRYDYLTALTL